jgi:hypothetical protein
LIVSRLTRIGKLFYLRHNVPARNMTARADHALKYTPVQGLCVDCDILAHLVPRFADRTADFVWFGYG